MKKIILLSLLALLFLTGCKNKPNFTILQPTVISEPTKLFEKILPPDRGAYQEPKVTIHGATGVIQSEFSGKARNEISYTATQEDEENGRKRSIVSGYVYTYIYKDLGLKITTSPLYLPYFYESEDGLILKRNGNIIYLSGTTSDMPDYIEVFYKNPKTSFIEEIRQNHLPEGCTLETGTFDKSNAFYPAMVGFEVIYIASADGNLASNGEIFDKQFPENRLNISFVMDPQKTDRYYKISHGDCAPGPCTIFGKIEFF